MTNKEENLSESVESPYLIQSIMSIMYNNTNPAVKKLAPTNLPRRNIDLLSFVQHPVKNIPIKNKCFNDKKSQY